MRGIRPDEDAAGLVSVMIDPEAGVAQRLDDGRAVAAPSEVDLAGLVQALGILRVIEGVVLRAFRERRAAAALAALPILASEVSARAKGAESDPDLLFGLAGCHLLVLRIGD